MKTFLIGTVAAIGLALAVMPNDASAYWAVRTAYRFDPVYGTPVAYPESYWVPEVVVAPALPPVVYTPAYRAYYPRPFYPVYRDRFYAPRPGFEVNFFFRR
jgi:hypothetical protein